MLSRKRVKAVVAATQLLFLSHSAFAKSESTEQEAKRDLTNYASIVVGYELDERCRVLNSRQRSDYLLHMKVIRHGLEKKGLPIDILNQIEEDSRATSYRQFSGCDHDVAELIERLGALTASLGEYIANWLAHDKKRKSKN